MVFDSDYFQKRKFTDDQIGQYFDNAGRDLQIAETSKVAEVVFTFSYQAFLKSGIALIASKGYKVKSRQGHHVQIISQMAKILEDDQVGIFGEAMRRKRNIDLYTGGTLITKKEANEFLRFTMRLVKKIQILIHKN